MRTWDKQPTAEEREGRWQIDIEGQTPSRGLRHPSFNHCHSDYPVGLEKLSAYEQFFDDAQTAVSL